jgi:hypothetical protein
MSFLLSLYYIYITGIMAGYTVFTKKLNNCYQAKLNLWTTVSSPNVEVLHIICKANAQ